MTSMQDLQAAVAAVHASKDRWADTSVEGRIGLLTDLLATIAPEFDGWVAAAVAAKGITPGSHGEAEEWLGGPLTLTRNIRLLRASLQSIAKRGHPKLPGAPRTRAGGQVVAPVFPTGLSDRLFFVGFRAEVWMEPEVRLAQLHAQHQAAVYRTHTPGRVCAIMGAGNVASIPPMDALYKLFAENCVVVLKFNPVNAYLGPFFERGLRPLIDAGVLRLVYGGADVGQALCEHPQVDTLHITGSSASHDAIVFGTGAEGAERKTNQTPKNPRPMSSELGNVSPVIVVPGPWTAADLAYQGVNLASMLTNNAGFNCNATRVVVQHADWTLREPLLDALRTAFKQTPPRAAYYPGAADRWQRFLDAHPQAERLGARAVDASNPGGADGSGHKPLPWTLVPHLNPERTDDICFTTEAFCSVMGETAIAADSVASYLQRAVTFCNEVCDGTLNVGLIVHPQSLQDPAIAHAIDQAIAHLRYGSVVINHWPALSYGLCSTTWGAYPGHPLHDIQSGSGVVHNTYLFNQPQKSVVWGPFRVTPRPVWFCDNKTSVTTARNLARYEAAPSPLGFVKVLAAAMRG